MNNNGILRGNNVVKLIPDQALLKLNIGDSIRISAEDFDRLSAAFLEELSASPCRCTGRRRVRLTRGRSQARFGDTRREGMHGTAQQNDVPAASTCELGPARRNIEVSPNALPEAPFGSHPDHFGDRASGAHDERCWISSCRRGLALRLVPR